MILNKFRCLRYLNGLTKKRELSIEDQQKYERSNKKAVET